MSIWCKLKKKRKKNTQNYFKDSIFSMQKKKITNCRNISPYIISKQNYISAYGDPFLIENRMKFIKQVDEKRKIIGSNKVSLQQISFLISFEQPEQ